VEEALRGNTSYPEHFLLEYAPFGPDKAAERKIVEVNPAFEKLFGNTHEKHRRSVESMTYGQILRARAAAQRPSKAASCTILSLCSKLNPAKQGMEFLFESLKA